MTKIQTVSIALLFPPGTMGSQSHPWHQFKWPRYLAPHNQWHSKQIWPPIWVQQQIYTYIRQATWTDHKVLWAAQAGLILRTTYIVESNNHNLLSYHKQRHTLQITQNSPFVAPPSPAGFPPVFPAGNPAAIPSAGFPAVANPNVLNLLQVSTTGQARNLKQMNTNASETLVFQKRKRNKEEWLLCQIPPIKQAAHPLCLGIQPFWCYRQAQRSMPMLYECYSLWCCRTRTQHVAQGSKSWWNGICHMPYPKPLL